MRRLLLVVFSLLALANCSRPKASADYATAQASWDSITTRNGDDAYADPEMDRIVALLDKVPATSTDAAAANALKAKIASEKARIAEEAKRRQADLAVLHAPLPATGGGYQPPAQQAPPPPALKDEPAEDSSQPQVGLPFETFQKKYGSCFSEGEMINVTNLGVRARSFTLVTTEDCKKRHGDFATKWLLVNDGKIIGMVGKDTVKQIPVEAPDAGAGPAAAARPDGG